METFTLSLGRCWLTRAVGRNPLVRTCDRVEALILILVFAAALVIAPVAGAIGTAVHDGHARAYADQSRDRHLISATVIEDPTTTAIGDATAGYDQTRLIVRAPVRWRIDGVDYTEILKVDQKAKVGDPADIWVDGRGHRVAAPVPMSQAGIDALVVASASWLGMMAGVAGLSALVRAGVTRRRNISWDRELRTLVNNGGGRTGSQT
jgi:hypothetical protein